MKSKMKLNKVIVSALLIAVLVFVSGIEGCPGKDKEKVIPGLTMSFVENAPPLTINTEQKIPIYADVKNSGGVHIGIGKAMFFLSGVGENLEGVTEELSNKKFLDKTIGSERLKFAATAHSLLELEKTYIFPLTLTGCYDYETITQVQACIAEPGSDICSIEGEKITSTSNSASPIQITSFTEKLEGNKLIATFIIENKGVVKDKPGEAYSRDADCRLINSKDINEVLKKGNVNVEISAGKDAGDFTCNLDEGKTSISTTGKSKVTCEKKISETEGDYLTPFKINLKYKYVDSIGIMLTLIPA